MASDNDKLFELTEKEKQEQQKNLTKEAIMLQDIEHQLRSLDGDLFDFHLFLVLFNIFKESQTDIRLRQYVAQMPTDNIPRYKSTIRFFNDFLHEFIVCNVEAPYNKTGIMKLTQNVTAYNKAQGETIFRLPDLEEGRPSMFKGIMEKLKRGQERLLKRK